MQPKTKLQKYVAGLSAKLSPITYKQRQYGVEKCLSNYAIRSRGTLYCLECGHSWKDEYKILTDVEAGCTCPECGKNLKMRNYSRNLKEMEYFGIMTTKKDMQVIRLFSLRKFMQKGQTPEICCDEVMQHWIDRDGNVTTMSLAVNGLSRYYDEWIYNSNMEVRMKTGSYKSEYRLDIDPYVWYKDRRILPVIKRNGFDGKFYGNVSYKLFSAILKDDKAELLLKTGQIPMFKYRLTDYYWSDIDKYWNSILICIRHKYIINHSADYLDYLSLLDHFGKDLRNPHFVCPENLKKVHNRYVRKKMEQDKRIELEERKKQIEADQAEYEKAKKCYFGIEFSDQEIKVHVLTHVSEFLEEANAHHHCVFSNEYYKKENALILSAMHENERIETIEVSLKDFTIIQSRGNYNSSSEYHQRILDLVNNNINLIRKRKNQKITA